jgi:ribosomal-protein-alanine N-acetyltransferase
MENWFSDLPTLETDRLLLRQLTLRDAEDIFAYASDPEMPRFLNWDPHRSVDDSFYFVRTVLEQYQNNLPAPWGIIHKADGRVIGTAGFCAVFPAHGRAEIAYALARRYWGQGITPDAVRAVIAAGFGGLHLTRIQAICDIDNVASARVMEKAGLRFEAVLRGYMTYKGRVRAMKMYAVLRDEWRP